MVKQYQGGGLVGRNSLKDLDSSGALLIIKYHQRLCSYVKAYAGAISFIQNNMWNVNKFNV